MNARQNLNDSQFAGIAAICPELAVMVWLLAVNDFCGEHSPIDSVSNLMELHDYHAEKKSKFIANLIVIGCIVFIQ